MEAKEEKPKGLTYNQALIFGLTACFYGFLHCTRSAWGLAMTVLQTPEGPYTAEQLSYISTSFLFSYAIGLYFSGYLGDRIKVRYFIPAGAFLAMAGFLGLAILWGVFGVQSVFLGCLLFIVNGIGQSAGWPGCLSVLSNWFAVDQRGVIIGIWGGNINVGNIIGQELGNWILTVPSNWPLLLFIVGGMVILLVTVMFIFMKVTPKDAGIDYDTRAKLLQHHEEVTGSIDHEIKNHLTKEQGEVSNITFLQALKIPNVINYAIIYMNCKGIVYAIIFWLPTYLKNNIGFSTDQSAWLLPQFDLGTLIGAIVMGAITDKLKNRSIPLLLILYIGCASYLILYPLNTTNYFTAYLFLLFINGWCLGGAGSLIGGVIVSDLGESSLLKGNGKAISTVSGIVEGSGTVAAAFLQLAIPAFGDSAFLLYAGMSLLAAVLLTPLALADYKRRKARKAKLAEQID